MTRNTKKTPPEPFTTSILQQKASNELHMSPKETMKHAQKLYEGGYITYMRTDSKFYSPEFIEQAKNYIENEWGNEYIKEDLSLMSLRKKTDKTTSTTTSKTKKTNNKKTENVQEAHEAIRPTKLDTIADNMRITSSITPRAKNYII